MISKRLLNEVKEHREANISVNGSVEASLKRFDVSLNTSELEYKISVVEFINTIVQRMYHIGVFIGLKIQMKTLKFIMPVL